MAKSPKLASVKGPQEHEQKQRRESAETIKAPRWLPAPARPVWRVIRDQLDRFDVLWQSDQYALARYCWYVSRWVRTAEEIERLEAQPIDYEDLEDEELDDQDVDDDARRIKPSTRAKLVQGLEERIYKLDDKLVRLEKLLGLTVGARARIKEILQKGGGKSSLDEYAGNKDTGRARASQ